MKKVLIFSFFLSICFGVTSQLQTYNSAVHLMIGSDFLGQEFVVSNVQYTGSYYAVGSFEGSNTNIGISTGVVMTTGTIMNNGPGPIGPNDDPSSGQDNGYPGTVYLDPLASYTNYNSAVIEFDFVPSVDSIKLKYVFGSEEYPEFAPPNNSSYNDVFAILLSGPGIPGLKNIATLPNGQTVGITTVNPVTNSSYYNSNGDGYTSPYNSSNFYIQYDGLTDVLIAKSELQIGLTYHMIIAIADVADGIYDSGIFIGSCETCNFTAEIEENTNSSTILYPNPANTELFVKSDESIQYIEIVDLSGKIINVYDGKESINISGLQNGTYFAKFLIMGELRIEKFVVMH